MSKLASQVATCGYEQAPQPRPRSEPVPDATQAPGENVPGALIAGKYRLQWPLGEGGMGSVWLAQNVHLDTPVALKRILPGMQNEQTRQRLAIEARVGARLRHPGIVRVFDFGRTEGDDAFIVMEVMEGINLGQLVARRGRLEPIEAVQLILPIVDALRHAHACGVVHRDLKPENIFLDRVGSETHPKLLDFGIAKLTHEPSPTGCGQVIGSPAYMAPEQARGEGDVDHRADVWAICVVLYEAITGTLAFAGGHGATLRSVIDAEVEPLEDRNAGEDALWPILKRGLQKDRERRYQSMGELGTALAGWLTDRGETEDLRGSRLSRSWGAPARGDAATALQALDPAATKLPVRPPGRRATIERATSEVQAPEVSGRRWRGEVMLALAAVASLAVMCLPAEGRPGRPAAIPVVRAPLAAATIAAADVARAQDGPALAQGPASLIRTREWSWAPSSRVRATPEPQRDENKQAVKRITEADLGLKVPY